MPSALEKSFTQQNSASCPRGRPWGSRAMVPVLSPAQWWVFYKEQSQACHSNKFRRITREKKLKLICRLILDWFFLIPWHWEVLLGHRHHLLALQYKNCSENKVSHRLPLTAFKLKQLQLTPIPIQAQAPRHTWLKLADKPGGQAFLARTWYSAFAPPGMPCARGSPNVWAQGCKATIQCICVPDTDTSSLPSLKQHSKWKAIVQPEL